MLYKAEIRHSRESLIKLYVTEFRVYKKRTVLFRLLLGTAAVIQAVPLSMPRPYIINRVGFAEIQRYALS